MNAIVMMIAEVLAHANTKHINTYIHTMHACRDVACDVQVQRMLASHLAATHCQVDAHRVLFGRIICMYVCIGMGGHQ